MKKRILALLLAGLLLLSGCTSMLERSDVSATTHVDYSTTEDSSILRVETYPNLVNALLHFVSERADSGTVRLYNYTGDVESDLKDACHEVLHEDPLGAFSVEDIQYDSTRILTYYEVDLAITYSRTADEVDAIRDVTGISGLRQALAQMVDAQSDQLALQVSYFSGNEDLIWQLLTLARYDRPELYRDPGGSFSYDISIYPETGSRRIVEIKVDNWGAGSHTTTEDHARYTRQLEEAADLLLAANPPASASYTVEEALSVFRSACGGYDFHGTNLALGTLTGAPASEFGVMIALEYLLRRCGIEAIPVLGTPDSWLIVSTEDGYRHLLPSDVCAALLRDAEPEEPPEPSEEPSGPSEEPSEPAEEPAPIPLYTDEQLDALGRYEWLRSLYPICEGSEPEPLPVESAPPAIPEEEPEKES